MAGVRAIQKEKTRRALIDAAFNQLSAEKSFSLCPHEWHKIRNPKACQMRQMCEYRKQSEEHAKVAEPRCV